MPERPDWLDDPRLAQLARELSTHVANSLRDAGFPPVSLLVVAAGMIASITKNPGAIDKVLGAVSSMARHMAEAIRENEESSDGRKT